MIAIMVDRMPELLAANGVATAGDVGEVPIPVVAEWMAVAHHAA